KRWRSIWRASRCEEGSDGVRRSIHRRIEGGGRSRGGKPMSGEVTRRTFLKAAGGAAVAAGLAARGAEAAGQEAKQPVPPSEKVTIGIVGVAGRGFGHHFRTFSSFPDVQIGAVCDVYDAHLERAVSATQGKAKGYKDF